MKVLIKLFIVFTVLLIFLNAGADKMTKKNTKGLKPGEKAPVSGQYQQIGVRGGKGREVTVTKNEPLPPTERKGQTYNLTDRTKNKSGK